jgi:hypothetical protein
MRAAFKPPCRVIWVDRSSFLLSIRVEAHLRDGHVVKWFVHSFQLAGSPKAEVEAAADAEAFAVAERVPAVYPGRVLVIDASGHMHEIRHSSIEMSPGAVGPKESASNPQVAIDRALTSFDGGSRSTDPDGRERSDRRRARRASVPE